VLIKNIKDRQVAARIEAVKNKSAEAKVEAKLLTTLLGEADRQSKMVDGEKVLINDEDLQALIKKFLKDSKLSCTKVTEGGNAVAIEVAELDLALMEKFLTTYLPQQMSEAELTDALNAIIGTLDAPDMKQMGRVMGQLNGKYKGLFDGNLASTLVRKALAS
jgi:uncharacterized protein YqeY